jgi:hypothetical protein
MYISGELDLLNDKAYSWSYQDILCYGYNSIHISNTLALKFRQQLKIYQEEKENVRVGKARQ